MCKLTYEIVRRIVISETSWYIIPVAITIANQSFHRNLHVYYKCFLPSDRNMACVRYENKNTSVIFISTHKLGKKYNGIFKANFSCTNEINISILLHHWVCSLIDNTHEYHRGCLTLPRPSCLAGWRSVRISRATAPSSSTELNLRVSKCGFDWSLIVLKSNFYRLTQSDNDIILLSVSIDHDLNWCARV